MVGLSHLDAAQRPGPSTLDGCMDISTRLLRPDGQDLGETWACGAMDPVRLPADGTYAVEIHPVNARTIDLTVRLYEVPGS
jgi:hypothetical protein